MQAFKRDYLILFVQAHPSTNLGKCEFDSTYIGCKKFVQRTLI